MSSAPLPVLLPPKSYCSPNDVSRSEWTPKARLDAPQPPPAEDARTEQEMAAFSRHLMDGKAMKKIRPRRTVDYGGGMGRWALMRKLRPNPTYVPHLRPSLPYVIDLLPPKAYPDNTSTSLCTKFVHTSTNKIRCPVNVVTWTPEARRILTGSTSGEFTLWNGLTFNFETILQAHDSAVRAMKFNHSGAYLASADQSGIIKYFQPNMNNLTAWPGHREAVRGLSFSPDDQRFATASDDSTIRIWDFEERREEAVLTGHGWDVRCVEWHATKGLLVSGSKDNLIKFWDPRTGTALATLHQHKNTIQALAWSPNGNLVASASRDQTVRVFDIRAMKEFRVLKGHKKEVCSVTWHPIHPILVTGGSEGSILHWDLSVPESQTTSTSPQPQPRAALQQAHDSNVWSLAFHPLGHLLASASNDHTTRFWSRERPGDVFAGGAEKPPEVPPGQDEDEDAMLPGLAFGENAEAWWGKDEDAGPAVGVGAGAGAMYAQMGPGGPMGMMDTSEDFIPGFGSSAQQSSSTLRHPTSLPSQAEMFVSNGGGETWEGRAPGRTSRWGPRRGRHGS